MKTTARENENINLTFAREVVAKEVEYRREKQWRIFSWTSTFLLAAIGGVVVLAGKGEFVFSWSLRLIMVLALSTISIYAIFWIHENIKFESSSRRDLQRIDDKLQIKFEIPNPQGKPMFGYGGTVALLAIAAVLAVLLAPDTLSCVNVSK